MQRKRCSDELFLEAVYSSNNYSEIAEKTGQKLSTTMARYIRVKNLLDKRGIYLPKMQRKKTVRANNIDRLVEKARLLQTHYKP